MRTILLALALLVPFPAAAFEPPDWRSQEQREHPLVGKAFEADGRAAGLAEIAAAAAKAEFVLLGETHDNRDHHALQAAILRAMAQAGRRPAVVFEMIPRGLQGEIDAFLASPAPDVAAFGAAVKWGERGWPDWETYRPILEVALEFGLPVAAGDLDRETVRAVGRQGAAALAPGEAQRFGLDLPLDAARANGMLDAVDEGHCGLMPREALTPMVTVQRARDGSLADAMLAAAKSGGDGAVLIAGAGHTRKDLGVPAVLSGLAPGATVLAVAMAEARAGEDDAQAHAGGGHDFVIVTPAALREDQCEALRRRMGKQ